MKKKFKLENLDCANCARKMEEGINKLDNCISCNINFMAQKITIEAEDEVFNSVVDEAQRIIKKVHSSTKILVG